MIFFYQLTSATINLQPHHTTAVTLHQTTPHHTTPHHTHHTTPHTTPHTTHHTPHTTPHTPHHTTHHATHHTTQAPGVWLRAGGIVLLHVHAKEAHITALQCHEGEDGLGGVVETGRLCASLGLETPQHA